MSLADLVDALAAQLDAAGLSYGHGTTCALDEAAWLALWALGLPLDTDLAEVPWPDAAAEARVRALIDERIRSRKPTAYLTGEAWLQGLAFEVDERCIIPRSLIAELLVDGGIDPWLGADTQRVLDLCTGNGSLAIIAALVYPDVEVTASDISADALAVARRNVERHAVGQRVHLLESDGLKARALRERAPFDLILCNPPYVPTDSMATLPAEYRHEPALALAAGADGMDFVRVLLGAVAGWLSEQGVLVLEIGHERPHFEAAFPRLEVVWLPTSAGEDQVLLLTRTALLANAAP